MMPFCPNCGTALDELAAAMPPQQAEDAAVKIARIEADRDIRVAEISAQVARKEIDAAPELAEIEGETAARVASAEIAVAGALMEGAESDSEPAPSPEVADEGDTVVVNDVDADAPPPAEAVEGSQPPEPAGSRKRGLGLWGSS